MGSSQLEVKFRGEEVSQTNSQPFDSRQLHIWEFSSDGATIVHHQVAQESDLLPPIFSEDELLNIFPAAEQFLYLDEDEFDRLDGHRKEIFLVAFQRCMVELMIKGAPTTLSNQSTDQLLEVLINRYEYLSPYHLKPHMYDDRYVVFLNQFPEVGSGAVSKGVFVGFDRNLRQRVAIKVIDITHFVGLKPSDVSPLEQAKLFEGETAIASGLVLDATKHPFHEAYIQASYRHPNIMPVSNCFYVEGRDEVWHVFPYYQSKDNGGEYLNLNEYLAKLLQRQKNLPYDKVWGIFSQITAALMELRTTPVLERGQSGKKAREPVEHQDTKPANLMLNLESGEVMLLDFGTARTLPPYGSYLGDKINGTPSYINPEQVKSVATTFHSDIYILGVLLYELVTGKALFSSSGDSILELLTAVKHAGWPNCLLGRGVAERTLLLSLFMRLSPAAQAALFTIPEARSGNPAKVLEKVLFGGQATDHNLVSIIGRALRDKAEEKAHGVHSTYEELLSQVGQSLQYLAQADHQVIEQIQSGYKAQSE